jgi:hypothetical protein
MSAVEIAMIAGLPYTALRNAVLTHPTFVEGLFPLFSSAALIPSTAGTTAVPRGLGESGQSGRPHLGDVPRRGVSSTGVRYARASTRPMLS